MKCIKLNFLRLLTDGVIRSLQAALLVAPLFPKLNLHLFCYVELFIVTRLVTLLVFELWEGITGYLFWKEVTRIWAGPYGKHPLSF